MLAGDPTIWLQKAKVASTMEAKYMSLSEVTKNVMFLKELLIEMMDATSMRESVLIYCDNQSAIELSKHDSCTNRSKHIDTRYHYVRDKVQTQDVKVEYLRSESISNLQTYIFTKALRQLGMIDVSRY
ncbi:hypothetical protein QLX08_010107 [Tetragonisca angustula]|uniref:Gag-pol polyprotein n=1 Tax=Tetragonisca angustula TaxID=166442 RepID=A0AAW0ZG24_9HYME